MNLDFKEIGKANFKCMQFGDGSIYYGELEHLNVRTGEIVYNFEELPEKDKEDCKRVRHGYGIQLFGKAAVQSGKEILCKYAGQWDRNKKHGEGQCVYPDGSEFRGHFRYDQFDGYGQFQWADEEGAQKPNVYEGYWKEGHMDGGGEFRNQHGDQLKGLFKNNHYNHKNQLFLNPFQSNPYNKQFYQNAIQHDLECQRLEKEEFEKVRLYKVRGAQELEQALNRCREDNRTPLILSSLESKVEYEGLMGMLGTFVSSYYKIYESSLRENELKHMQGVEALAHIRVPFSFHFQATLNAQLITALNCGGVFLLKFDELSGDYAQDAWKEMYDPDIDHVMGMDALPVQIWRAKELQKRALMENCGVIDKEQDENSRIAQFQGLLFSIFQFLLWSKEKFSEDLEDKELLRLFRKRFEKPLPLHSINMVLIQRELEQPPEEDENKEPDQ